MRLRNVAVLLCATSALLYACGSDDDSAPSGGAGAGGKSTAGAGGKGAAGAAGKAGSGNVAGSGEAGTDEAGGAGATGNTPEGGMGGEGGEGGAPVVSKKFTVTLENVAPVKAFTSSGIFNTPVGDGAAGPATPGKKYEFTVDAGRKQKLHFATMLAATNDLFYGPSGDGIALYDANGDPIAAMDVTSQISLWDAGTEVNEEPHVGPNTVTNQTAPNTGVVENGNVVTIANATDGVAFNYPAVSAVIKVSFVHTTGTLFKVTIENVSSATALMTSAGNFPAPLSPGVWVVSSAKDPLFKAGSPDYGKGLERIAEDGNAAPLGAYAAANSGITYPASPGVWVVHSEGSKPLFTTGAADLGKGIEAIAEDGNPAPLGTNLATLAGFVSGAVFNIPVGNVAPGAITPGAKFQFSFTASPGESLSFASMLAATNDVFFAPAAAGIPLFDADGEAVTGDVSARVSLWDAGTEGNEEPGIGPNTVTNQLAPNTGTPGEGKVQLLSAVTTDTYPYPTSQSVLKVTLAAE
ncbi:MAG: spondin domain-containing protein [Myxococcales bacterium]